MLLLNISAGRPRFPACRLQASSGACAAVHTCTSCGLPAGWLRRKYMRLVGLGGSLAPFDSGSMVKTNMLQVKKGPPCGGPYQAKQRPPGNQPFSSFW